MEENRMNKETKNKKTGNTVDTKTGKIHVLTAVELEDTIQEIQKIRLKKNDPIIVVCKKRDMAQLLDVGADDCVERGCTQEELDARLRALGRRSSSMKFNDALKDIQFKEVFGLGFNAIF